MNCDIMINDDDWYDWFDSATNNDFLLRNLQWQKSQSLTVSFFATQLN